VRSPNWLGDAVMSLPAFRDIRRHFSADEVAVATPAGLAAFYRAVPDVSAIVPLAGDGGLGRSRDVEAVAAGRFDIAILFTNSFNSA
jgi:heptosyltransferase-2